MSPEDRHAITRSIANLWTFNALFVSRLMLSLREEGVLSERACERLLQELDRGTDILDGEDDQAYATGLLASVRTILAQDGKDPAGG